MENNWGHNYNTKQENKIALGCITLYLAPFILDFLIAKFILPQEFKSIVAAAMFIPFINVVILAILGTAGLMWLIYLIYTFVVV